MGRLTGCAIVLGSTIGCGGLDDPAPLVTMTITADTSQAGACPTPPGRPSECAQITVATATLHERAGAAAPLFDVKVDACNASGCREMTYAARPGEPPPGTTVPAHGSLEYLFRIDHTSSTRPDVIRGRARVLSPRRTGDIEAEFRFPTRPSPADP